jgi:hypothetical protein
MSKNQKFGTILNECIERVIKGDSIQSCLESFPEQAKELEPLLRTALETLQAAKIQPRPEFRQRAAWEFQQAVQNLPPRHAAHHAWKWQLRWLIPVTAVFAVLVAGTGTVFAASDSLPDQTLYPVKIFTENTRITLTPSPAGKAELYAKFADTRVNEIVKMADAGKVAQMEKAAERMNGSLAAIARLTKPGMNTESGTVPAIFSIDASANKSIQATAPSQVSPAPVITPPATSVGPNIRSSNTTTFKIPTAKSPVPSRNATPVPPSALSAASTNVSTSNARIPTINPKDKAELQYIISQQAMENAKKMKEALSRVPDSVKPSLEKAMNDAGKGYGQALNNIGDKK